MSILTLNEGLEHLRYEVGEQDSYIESLIGAAEQAIKDYTGAGYDENSAAIKHAAKILIGYYDLYGNGEQPTPTNGNYLPAPVIALLYKYRTPVAM